jgi:hypothetical protein
MVSSTTVVRFKDYRVCPKSTLSEGREQGTAAVCTAQDTGHIRPFQFMVRSFGELNLYGTYGSDAHLTVGKPGDLHGYIIPTRTRVRVQADTKDESCLETKSDEGDWHRMYEI